MEPLLPAVEREAEDNDAKRKIQFSVPSAVPIQLDPRQVELIRRRRPTPATLFRLTDPPSPEDDSGCHQWLAGENRVLKTKTVNNTSSTYQPPSLKAVQRMAQAHLSSIDMNSVDQDDPPSGEEEEDVKSPQLDSDTQIQNNAQRDRYPLPDVLRATEEAGEEEKEDRRKVSFA
ncbi:protein phosphatase 1 regulatory subunit 1B-like [Corythoichthys intestinalis]|uniref:protein phosphatase 1 regulatory subunit 1B-like n=1 Tax=Corythoichthys intestinalis TaxID=161448 RepID=UPI0025A666FE|nr:protein phosphatase 1 regulatory subunit 1B-like [Corythoichthys intestinalis]XP_057681795.1 protein phosphatase 1 regulatory subunit 1B-like [Corythoichthys intestinalis]XP_057681796.1 protein phosphatase 1 regulatory subunit 1B-like [Corythoichthys intestinalis]XP_061807223.1 protein phosphatase 1 regulatory subunit 1B-like [Nerophis lumbriciformis]